MMNTALAVAEKADDVTLTSSLPEIVPTLDQCNALPQAEFQIKLREVLLGAVVFHEAAKLFIVSAKLRLQKGETVLGCTKFTGEGGFVDTHIKDAAEKLGVAVRRTYRILEGVGANTKFDSSQERKRLKEAKEDKEKKAAEKKEAERKRKAEVKDRKAKKTADDKAAKASKKKIDDAVEAKLVLKKKENSVLVEEGFDRSEKEVATLKQFVRDLPKAHQAVDELVHLILKNRKANGEPNFSTQTQRQIVMFAEKIRLYETGKVD